MRLTFALIRAAVLFGTASSTLAQAPQADQDHTAHHLEAASAPAPGVRKAPGKAKSPAAKPKASAAAASASMGMGMGRDMGTMHDAAHKPGEMHEQMHGKGSKRMGDAMSAVPAVSAASK